MTTSLLPVNLKLVGQQGPVDVAQTTLCAPAKILYGLRVLLPQLTSTVVLFVY